MCTRQNESCACPSRRPFARQSVVTTAVIAGLTLGVAEWAQAQPCQPNCVHGIGFAKSATTPINIGDEVQAAYTISNSVDTGLDTLTITSIVDTVQADGGAFVTGNLLPLLTLNFTGGASCNGDQTVCTIPPGASISSEVFGVGYFADVDDFNNANPLVDLATLTWQDTCDNSPPPSNCVANVDLAAVAVSQTTIEDICCLPDNTCDSLPPDECTAQGGTPLGDCGELEACCLPDNSCEDLAPSCCEVKGGIPQGPDIMCTEPQGCCLPDGTCIDTDPLCCGEAGGVVVEGTCSEPEGCCLDDGTCADMDPLCCAESGGTLQGPGTTCTESQGCCLSDGTCTDLDPLCCTESGGTLQGPGTMCSESQGCCQSDGTCTDLDPLCCDEAGGVVVDGPCSELGSSCMPEGDQPPGEDTEPQAPGTCGALGMVGLFMVFMALIGMRLTFGRQSRCRG